MRFPYQSGFVVGQAPPSLPPGTLLRWRPFAPVQIREPNGPAQRTFTRALLDTGADETIFPANVVRALGLTPLPAPGQQVVWRGVYYPMAYAEVWLVLSDGLETYSWRTIVGFSPAPIPYVILGQTSSLEFFDVTFLGERQYVELRPNGRFQGTVHRY
jgi:hypothetical protein